MVIPAWRGGRIRVRERRVHGSAVWTSALISVRPGYYYPDRFVRERRCSSTIEQPIRIRQMECASPPTGSNNARKFRHWNGALNPNFGDGIFGVLRGGIPGRQLSSMFPPTLQR